MSNPFTYAELHTTDAAAAKAFYGQLFDWKIKDTPTPMGTYTEIDTGDGVPGGIFQPKEGGTHWLPYILVGDVAASTVKAKRLGAQAIKENQEVPGLGRYSVLVDPTGATFGLWEKTAARG